METSSPYAHSYTQPQPLGCVCLLEKFRILHVSSLTVALTELCALFFSFVVSGIYLLLWLAYYSSWVSDDQQSVCIDALDHTPTIQLVSQHLSYLLEVFSCS